MSRPKKHGGTRAGSGRRERATTKVLVSLPDAALALLDREVARRKAAGEKPAPSRGSVIAERFG